MMDMAARDSWRLVREEVVEVIADMMVSEMGIRGRWKNGRRRMEIEQK